jgi:hypothetical protein
MTSTRNALGALTVAFVSFCSQAAFADFCSTSSRGLFFGGQGDINSATSAALSQCSSNQLTSNSECQQNVRCGFQVQYPYQSSQIACSTESHGIGFQIVGSPWDINSLTSGILGQCTSDQVTSNSECQQSLRCDDFDSASVPYPSGQVSCMTSSAGLRFVARGQSSAINSIVSQTLGQCTSNQVTSNSECTSQLVCRDGGFQAPPQRPQPPQPPRPGSGVPHGGFDPNNRTISCSTQSHGLNFEQRGAQGDINSLTSAVISQCTSNQVTSNSECTSNVRCGGGFQGRH